MYIYRSKVYITNRKILKKCLYVIYSSMLFLYMRGQDPLKFLVLSSHSSYDTVLFLY